MRTSALLPVLSLLSSSAAMLGAVDLPRKSPEFTIHMASGSPLQLSQFRGKYVVMAFILTTCPHCQRAVACLDKDSVDYSLRGLQVLAVSVEPDGQRLVPGFIQKFHPHFPVGFNSDGAMVLDFLQHPRALIPHMPMLVFIDRDGMIRAQYEGNDPFLEEKGIEANLRAGIENLMKPVRSAPPDTKKAAAPKRGSQP